MRVPFLIATCLLAVLRLAAADPLAEATAVLRINDAGWVEREATRFSAALGNDPKPLRKLLARALYRSADLAGVDTSRPAILAWRPGRAPLLAVVPVKNRSAFLDSFGSTPEGEAPLVRVGDRDGTVIYSQQEGGGFVEYRLLVSDNVAYLARSIEECRQMAAHPPARPAADAAPLDFSASPAWFAEASSSLAMPRELAAAEPLLRGALASGDGLGNLQRLWEGFAAQVERVTWQARPAGTDEVRLLAGIQAIPDSPLAAWIAAQKNLPSRLAPVLRDPSVHLLVAGQIAWQGQAERILLERVPALRGRHGAQWTPAVDEAWRSLAALWERAGAFAFAMGYDEQDRPQGSACIELPRAAEAVLLEATVDDVVAGGVRDEVEQDGRTLVRRRLGPPGATIVETATDRYVLDAQSLGGDPSVRLAALVRRLAQPVPPSGEPAVVGFWLDLRALLRPQLRTLGLLSEGDATELVGLLRSQPGRLEAELRLPLARLGQLLNLIKPPVDAAPRR